MKLFQSKNIIYWAKYVCDKESAFVWSKAGKNSSCGQIMPGKKLLQTCMKVVRVGLLMHAQASVAHCDILPNIYEINFKVTVQS